MQGDIFRAKQKERERLSGDKPELSRILSGVDDMSIADPYNKKDRYDFENRIEFEAQQNTDEYARVGTYVGFETPSYC